MGFYYAGEGKELAKGVEETGKLKMRLLEWCMEANILIKYIAEYLKEMEMFLDTFPRDEK